MKLFELRPDEPATSEVEATHRWHLPGVRCDVCGETWANTGLAYPAVDLSVLTNTESYVKPRPLPRADLERLVAAVSPLLPAGSPPLRPGTDFGPLVGEIFGQPQEIAWHDSWDFLVKKDLWEALQSSLKTASVDASLEQDGVIVPLVELQLEPHGRFAAESFPDGRPPVCSGCGRLGLKRPKDIVIDRSSVRGVPKIFRLAEFTTIVVATEEMVDIIERLGLRGARYVELAVA
jgi:uncharacterized double-CXXCG motif protein